ncbi:hypothetical protein J2Z83_003335 [Virgibacillus natechei]|uniref:Nucleotide kinase n=1 Tax=Virgibacillus natechei TaxID=1216297 RepID=A0ABS4ILM5_9BACI|nr:hypothetical protein [Virgibacillus natechei]MBP1971196.1 hypothetical protein [Virgibacillus natechei]UZD11943.1 hypothetical protein OLD84_13455 [Virgibacillus natechei]
MSKKTYYYVTGNTASGFINVLPTNVKDFNHVVILNHPSYTLKTAVISELIKEYEFEYDLEVLKSSIAGEFLDGVIIREKSLAVVVDTIATPDVKGAIELDLSLFAQEDFILTDERMKMKNKYEEQVKAAYDNFHIGLKIHDGLEEIFISQMNFDHANQLAEKLITILLGSVAVKDRPTQTFHRLFGTNTADGIVNVVPHLTEFIYNVYHIKGRAGTGKSTFMKKIVEACENHGLDVELYYCSFDPNSIDMVLVRELDFCIFDSTDPHEFFPQRKGEVIIDLYEEAVTPGTDEKFAEEIHKLNTAYKSFMKRGISDLKIAGEHLRNMEKVYNVVEKDVKQVTGFITTNIAE